MKITNLEPSKHVAERWLVFLENGDILRVSENEVVSFALYAGMDLTEEQTEELKAAAGRSAARSKALDYISHRPLSRKELFDKLTARPRDKEKPPLCTPDEAEAVCDWLEDLGYLNDAEYARTVAKHYSAKGYGEHKVKDEFFRRGIPRQYWEDALCEAEAPEEGVDAFLQKRFKGRAPDPKELKKAADALARRGYNWNDIREGLNRCGAGIDEE